MDVTVLKPWGDREAGKGHQMLRGFRLKPVGGGESNASPTSGVPVLVLGGSCTLYHKRTMAWPGVLMSALALVGNLRGTRTWCFPLALAR